MSRRAVVVVCLALGLVVAPGVAAADPPWHVPDGWGDQVRGDVCKHRGDPPCHATTTKPITTTKATTTTAPTTTTSTGGWSTSATTTTTAVSGTSATSATTTTTGVAGTTTASTTATSTTATSTTGTTVATTTGAAGATVPAQAPPTRRVALASADHGLASTGAAPLVTGVGGLAALLAGAVLLLFSRRRRA